MELTRLVSLRKLIKEGILYLGCITATLEKKFLYKQYLHSIILYAHYYGGSNAIALYKNLPDYIRDTFSVRLIIGNSSKRYTIVNKFINYYLHSKTLCGSELVLSTHGYLKGSKNYVELWHGIPIKKIGCFDYSVKLKDLRHRFKPTRLFISTSDLGSAILASTFGVSSRKFIVTGYPRNDMLFHPLRNKLVKLIGDFTLYQKVYFFLPTYSLDGEKQIGKKENWLSKVFGVDFAELDKILKFLDSNNILMVVKLHPYDEIYLRRIGQLDNLLELENKHIKFITSMMLRDNKVDLYELLGLSDLLITDVSSVFFDYLLLNKPIVFWKRKSNIPTLWADDALPGKVCYSFECLINSLKLYNDNPDIDSERRLLVRNLIHYYKDDKSSERVWKLIYKILT